MSLSDGFIKRPVLTTVCSIVIVLVGTICMALLPLDKLPQIAPKQIVVSANYVGADAKTTVDNVTTPIERQINGVDYMRWMTSNTDNNGNSSISVSFPVEIDSNTAQVLVQNRVAQSNQFLPQSVIATGVNTRKQSPSITLVYAFYSDKGADGKPLYPISFVNNYVDRYIWNDLRRIEGVGDLALFGGDIYAMRIWVDPDQLAGRGLTATDVVQAIQRQNFEVGAGSVGAQPAPPNQQFQIPVRVKGRVTTPEEAENIVVKVGDNGTLIRIKDIGRAELGSQSYSTLAYLDGDNPAVALVIYQLPGSNALDTANAIKAKLAELEKSFPPGLKYAITLDSTLFINAALKDLSITLIQAIALVVLIIFIFLQDWRTTLIPAVAIPVALIGAMIGLKALGFTLNQLTLFACVLATGLVVDDGIVIVEAISTKLSQGMRPVQAALDSMQELFGATIATSVVLMAVFVPVSFFPGTTGIVYRQFALTIAFGIAFSTFNALSFSPTMSGVMLRPPTPPHGPLAWLFREFNRMFAGIQGGYRRLIELLTHIKLVIVTIFIAGIVLTGWMYQTMPQAFVPAEDQGYLFGIVEAPPGVSLTYTADVSKKALTQIMQREEIEHALALNGFSFEGQNSNKAIIFTKLKPWDERAGAEKSVYGVIRSLNRTFRQKIESAKVFAVNAPAVDGLGNFDGLEMFIQDRQLKGMAALIDNAKRVMQEANQRPEIASAFTTYTFDSPMIEASIDRDKANAQNVDVQEILNTLQTYLGASYVNQYVLDGRLYRVYVQAEGALRSNPNDIGRLYIRSRNGAMIQLSNLLEEEPITYPPILTNYNVFPAIKLIISPAQGYSSGVAIKVMEEIAATTLQPGFGFEWTNTAFEEKSSGGAAPIVFGLGFVMVFLVLAAQYESYVDPTIIMITVPLAILGALGGIWLRATFIQPLSGGIYPTLNNNIYAQVALVMLIGLASKNAILIVEFANQARDLGMSITQAAIHAAEQRFRPIIMTVISSLVGFAPLLIAEGAGAVSRWSLGTAIFGGLLVSTLLSLLFVPNLYIVIKNLEENFIKGGGKPPKGPKPISAKDVESRPEPQYKEQDGGVPTFKASPQNE
ncbi:efflux RND transporter permease subunit [Gloeothece verrucosa]|uniref:Transporter, hydrophobe/amphiphile efflux-1 (HAE1) family n=1 Tax=Gloeothece verrucosa (strain PCC 7822) TaxID=497965 RepID=E0UCA3_GLOV7|nr:efflux RND transporter permease subunit [Gloeothece verrucosa]ADN12860.1 transporter, hydrophobe/amphiphile efflux-1 (HAE1) family [Gloeothece verrucosa PCC 7822]